MSMLTRLRKTRDGPPAELRDDPLSLLHRNVDELFADFLGGFERPMPEWLKSGFPDVDVSLTDELVRVTADLPGLDAKDVTVTLADGALRIAGEKHTESEEKDEKRRFVRRERTTGRFERLVPLPVDVLEEKVEATFTNGVLRIDLPRRIDEAARPRTVKIRTSG